MKHQVLITTAGHSDEVTSFLALAAEKTLGYTQIPRNKRSIRLLMDIYDADILVVGKQRYELYRKGMERPLFFHPDTAAFRLKRMMKGESDSLIEACNLTTGASFLDCTLGLSTDSIIASFAVGESGKVRGIESDPDVAFITKKGLVTYEAKFEELRDSMRRIEVIQMEAISYLKELPDSSWDVVYIDPMFTQAIAEATSFAPLREAGMHGSLTSEWVLEAKRVAKERVVVKAHFSDPVFENFGFQQLKRPNIKFHFGYIEK